MTRCADDSLIAAGSAPTVGKVIRPKTRPQVVSLPYASAVWIGADVAQGLLDQRLVPLARRSAEYFVTVQENIFDVGFGQMR
jgi:hypothetical protein